MNDPQQLSQQVLRMARRYGATDAEVLHIQSSEFNANVRRGDVESLTQSGSARLGMRLYRGERSACSSSADLSPAALERLVSETLAMAQITTDDPAAALPEEFGQACEAEALDLYDPQLATPDPEAWIELALRAEAAALAADPRISNSEGATFSRLVNRISLSNSRGFAGCYDTSTCSLHATPLAQENGEMQRDYWYSVAHRLRDLEEPEALGRKAAERVLRRLGARQVATQSVPVIFDPETAAHLLRSLCEAVSGNTIYRRSSFLAGKLGQRIGVPELTVIDDGRLAGGLSSRPFDGEGQPTQRTVVLENGVLRSYLLNTYSARKLQMAGTGNAVRGISSPPEVGPGNFYIEPGPHAPEEITSSVAKGLYVTEVIGFGVNVVNGDYSQGAAGVWIEDGRLGHAVHEVTVAGQLGAMLNDIQMIGNDLEARGPIYCPTLKFGSLMVSGS